MRSVSLKVLDIIRSDNLELIDLISIKPMGASDASTIHLCSGGETITIDSTEYLPFNLMVSQADERLISGPGNTPAVDVVVSNISADLAALLSRMEIEESLVTIKQCDRRLATAERDTWIVTKGILRDASLTRRAFGFSVVNIVGELERLVIPRRLWQPKCNVRFGSPACGVDLLTSPFTIETTVQSGSRTQYLVLHEDVLTEAGNPADPTDFWMNGYLIMVDGDIATQMRPFHRYAMVGSEHRFYVRFPFLQAPDSGDTLLIQRGCPKTKAACQERQGNLNNYHGFEEVPYGLIKPQVLGSVSLEV